LEDESQLALFAREFDLTTLHGVQSWPAPQNARGGQLECYYIIILPSLSHFASISALITGLIHILAIRNLICPIPILVCTDASLQMLHSANKVQLVKRWKECMAPRIYEVQTPRFGDQRFVLPLPIMVQIFDPGGIFAGWKIILQACATCQMVAN
jgi:hypothetical protein